MTENQAQSLLEGAILDREGSRGATFISHLRRAKDFVDANGRLPRSRARGSLIPREELQMGEWVRGMRRRRETQHRDRLDLIELVVPGMLEPVREYLDWEVRLKQYAEFTRTHGHRPRHLPTYPLPDEVVLSDWRVEVKRKPHLLTAEKLELIRIHHPDLLEAQDMKTWEESLEDFLEHVRIHGEEPRQSVAAERRLGLWATGVRCYKEKLTPQREAVLTKRAPQLLVPSTRNERMLSKRIAEILSFRETTGRLPRTGGKDRTTLERRLGGWCRAQRLAVGAMNPERLAAIREGLPGMLEGLPEGHPDRQVALSVS